MHHAHQYFRVFEARFPAAAGAGGCPAGGGGILFFSLRAPKPTKRGRIVEAHSKSMVVVGG